MQSNIRRVRVAGSMMGLLLLLAATASANNILIDNNPWGLTGNGDANNMTTVFGSNFQELDYATADASVFAPTTSFVFLEGGDGTASEFANYINNVATVPTILNWVAAGGTLLVQESADPGSGSPVSLAGVTMSGTGGFLSYCALQTQAGSIFGGGTEQCGSYISQDQITTAATPPPRFTVFMNGEDCVTVLNGTCDSTTGDSSNYPSPSTLPAPTFGSGNPAGAVLAGMYYGQGFIMFSTLTDSYWNYTQGADLSTPGGNPDLLNNIIGYTASAVPEPGTTVLMFGPVLLGAAKLLRKKQSKA